MAVNTTLNINTKIMEKINHAAEKRNTTRTAVIKNLLMTVMANESNRAIISGTVKYQDSCKDDSWHTFHISYEEDENQYFKDLRNFLNMSVSHLVAYAVRKYLDEKKQEKTTDDYRFENYILSKEMINGIVCWKIFWGIPDKIEQFIPL